MLCCHGNRPNPHLPKHKERTAFTPTPRKNLGLVGNLPLGILLSEAQALACVSLTLSSAAEPCRAAQAGRLAHADTLGRLCEQAGVPCT